MEVTFLNPLYMYIYVSQEFVEMHILQCVYSWKNSLHCSGKWARWNKRDLTNKSADTNDILH